MACKNCKWYMDCCVFATAIEESGVAITDAIADSICQCMRLGDKKRG